MSLLLADALTDPVLFGDAFTSGSWGLWRAVLKAANGDPMTTDEVADFRQVAERDPPGRRVKELWIIGGRRSGKDSIASAVATVSALNDYSSHLRPGERATIMCLASDRAQARICFRYVSGYFANNPGLQSMIVRQTEEVIELSNGAEIIVCANNHRTVRGRAICCAIFDEVALWKSENSANPDMETYAAVEPALTTLPGSMLIGISSPYRRSGLLFDRFARFFGKNDPEILVVRGPSKLFNPTLPQSVIDRALERDPEAAASEWLAEWRADIADYVSREAVEAVVTRGVFERGPISGVKYTAFCDPSGGLADSMTLAIAHREGDVGILDCLREVRPPFSPESVVQNFAQVLRSYGVNRVCGDRYAGAWPRERFWAHGVHYDVSEKAKSPIYTDFLPMLNSGKVELLDHQRMITQLCALERRVSRTGRDLVDHPVKGSDDVINSAAGALLMANAAPLRAATVQPLLY